MKVLAEGVVEKRRLCDVSAGDLVRVDGGGFTQAVHTALGDGHLEDLWLPFFCVSTSVSRCRGVVGTVRLSVLRRALLFARLVFWRFRQARAQICVRLSNL